MGLSKYLPWTKRKLDMTTPTANYKPSFDLSSAKQEQYWTNQLSIAAARELVTNSPIPKAYLTCLQRYVVGKEGFIVRPQILRPDGTLDVDLNRKVAAAWNDFSKPANYSTDRRTSRLRAELHWIHSMVCAGETFSRIVEGDRWKYGMAVQVLPPERIESPAVYDLRTFCGIKVDEWDSPVSYWFRAGETPISGALYGGPIVNYTEIPANQVLHTILPLRSDAVRGVSPLAPVAVNIADIDKVRESTRANLKHLANMLAVWSPDSEDSDPTSPDAMAKVDEATRMKAFAKGMANYFQSAPGTVAFAPSGGKFTQLDPKHPVSNYSEFVETENHQISPALGITPTLLLAELSNTSYSSSKAANQYDADTFALWQSLLIEGQVEPLYERWMRIQLKRGTFGITLESEAEILPYLAVKVTGRSFPMADRYKDAKAQSARLADRTTTRTAIVEAEGYDFEEDVVRTLAYEEEVLAKYGLPLMHSNLEVTYSDDLDATAVEEEATPAPAENTKQGKKTEEV